MVRRFGNIPAARATVGCCRTGTSCSRCQRTRTIPAGRSSKSRARAKPFSNGRARNPRSTQRKRCRTAISCSRRPGESRMARKLANGNYLVPQLFDKVVREYTPAGRIVWEVKTPNWPFTAIRLANGNTLINCTYGHLSIEVDSSGATVWQLGNGDLPEPLIKDAC